MRTDGTIIADLTCGSVAIMSQRVDRTLRVCVLYNNHPQGRDAAVALQLLLHFAGLRRYRQFEVWNNARVRIGVAVHSEIEREIKQSDVTLLLVSPDFLAWDLHDIIMPQICLSRDSNDMKVIAVIARECNWREDPLLSRIEVLPRGGSALVSLKPPKRDAVMKEIADRASARAPLRPGACEAGPAAVPADSWMAEIKLHIDESLIQTMIEEPPAPPTGWRDMALGGRAGLLMAGRQAYEHYVDLIMTSPRKIHQLHPMEHYLTAEFVLDAILRGDQAACNVTCVYPIHQGLSGLVRHALDPAERERVRANLLGWLRDRDTKWPTSRDFAAFALGMCRVRAGWDALLQAVEDPSELHAVRYYSSMALGMLRVNDVVRRLEAIHMREQDASLRSAIAHALLVTCALK